MRARVVTLHFDPFAGRFRCLLLEKLGVWIMRYPDGRVEETTFVRADHSPGMKPGQLLAGDGRNGRQDAARPWAPGVSCFRG